ncbi:MAG: DUF2652 domain-containing protein, partial [Myxococcales bacterium]|nr:DUF2652 domain-containing protein [Myxococcales bacterium]
MAVINGYMLIADISGYTAYLTTTELEHANPIILSLLKVLVEHMGEPLELWRLEGDAVMAYSTDEAFPSGETFLTICETLYNAFSALRLDIQANTDCPCRACAQVPDLDLKILVHHGPYEVVQIGPLRDISGKDVILVHRMTKTNVREVTGVRSYALISDAAFKAMGSPKGMTPYVEPIKHFGDVQMQVYDLAAAWARHRAARQRVYVPEAESQLTLRARIPVPPASLWQILVSANSKRQWVGLISVTVVSDDGRPGPGAEYHCVHDEMSFTSWVVDWEPFQYFSCRYLSPFKPHLSHFE